MHAVYTNKFYIVYTAQARNSFTNLLVYGLISCLKKVVRYSILKFRVFLIKEIEVRYLLIRLKMHSVPLTKYFILIFSLFYLKKSEKINNKILKGKQMERENLLGGTFCV